MACARPAEGAGARRGGRFGGRDNRWRRWVVRYGSPVVRSYRRGGQGRPGDRSEVYQSQKGVKFRREGTDSPHQIIHIMVGERCKGEGQRRVLTVCRRGADCVPYVLTCLPGGVVSVFRRSSSPRLMGSGEFARYPLNTRATLYSSAPHGRPTMVPGGHRFRNTF